MDTTEQPVLTANALQTLEGRYLWRDASDNIVETPAEMFMRVARVVAASEANYGATAAEVQAIASRFYSAMACGKFLPNSPTLMNAGRTLGLLSACFVLPIGDSVEEIFESVKHTAQIQRAGGGTGFSFDRLRPTGDYIASSGGRTSGPISFWRIFSEATRAIQQGAFRRGANMGMMSVGHPDILKFITAKGDLTAFENFNISVKVTDEFIHQLRAEPDAPHVVANPRTGQRYLLPRSIDIEQYSLRDLVPAQCETGGQEDRKRGSLDPGRKEISRPILPSSPPPVAYGDRPAVSPNGHYTRRDVWDMIVRGAHATGEPGLCFIDRVNADNPTPQLGRIEATNPCGEQPLLDYEACNLGSIDLAKFIRPGTDGPRFDERAFREMARLGVRFLDDVIDANNYIIPRIAEVCRGNRKIGLGIMGLADAMFELGIKYDSAEGLAFARRVAKVLTEEAFAASEDLARRRGCFPNWDGSTWRRRGRMMRNAAVTTVAPTGTLSILAGCSGGIEPAYALAFYRHILDGREMLEVSAPFQRHARRMGFWSERLARELARGARLADMKEVDSRTKEVFVTAHEVAPADHVRMQAAFQEFIDGAISKTINLPREATPGDVEAVYQLAFDLRCKGVTVYRDQCRAGQPMTSVPRHAIFHCPQCSSPLGDEPGCSRCPRCGSTLCSL
ncbi:MAG: adenosylcobalamin-dependent ribonucleoside-diphosphate reductase [Phycisphaerae bacterium]